MGEAAERLEWTWHCAGHRHEATEEWIEGCGRVDVTEPDLEKHPCPSCDAEMTRACEVCLSPIEGRHRHARTCGPPCRAEKARRRRAGQKGAKAHESAPRKRRTPRKPSTEKGTRIYLLPSELATLTTRSDGPAGKRAKAKLRDARARLRKK